MAFMKVNSFTYPKHVFGYRVPLNLETGLRLLGLSVSLCDFVIMSTTVSPISLI